VMAADLGAYAAAGAHAVQALMTGAGRPPSVHPNPWLFARLSWDPRHDARPLHRDWCVRGRPRGPRARRCAGAPVRPPARSEHARSARRRRGADDRTGPATHLDVPRPQRPLLPLRAKRES
jgi:hypothetical protein